MINKQTKAVMNILNINDSKYTREIILTKLVYQGNTYSGYVSKEFRMEVSNGYIDFFKKDDLTYIHLKELDEYYSDGWVLKEIVAYEVVSGLSPFPGRPIKKLRFNKKLTDYWTAVQNCEPETRYSYLGSLIGNAYPHKPFNFDMVSK